jgi:hypothetical protein
MIPYKMNSTIKTFRVERLKGSSCL